MADVAAVLADTVRRERAPILGGLLRLSGSLDAAEEAFQEAVVSALTAWQSALPANPGAWLMTAAKNAAKDVRRHEAIARVKAPLLVEEEVIERPDMDMVADDQLRLLFACCHPTLAPDNQIALTLKVVCGFSTEEIARSFLCTESTVSQRILRAKRSIEEAKVTFATPERSELGERVTAALAVVYAMFNEGHIGRTGPLMRLDLQAEALRLGRLLCDLLPREPEAFGLCALMAFHAARAKTRVDDEGDPILLSAQDRSKWDRELLREGLMARARARSLGGRGTYVLQAELAAVHATAATWESTDWASLVAIYDALDAEAPSPIVKMNRAIAISMLRGPGEGLVALKEIAGELEGYHLFYAARADLLERAGKDPRRDLEKALELATNDAERRLLRERIAKCS
jgi:RNA polymerase sigma-70 factor (ECF subfamily)